MSGTGAQELAALPLANSYWLLPGRLLAGEHPAGRTEEETATRVARLLACGVRTFVDLTQAEEMRGYEARLPADVDYVRFPLPDHGIPAEPAHMRQVLDCLHAALAAHRLVYLHCRAGIGRTGMVAGCLLVEHGRTGREALAELNRLWLQSARSQRWPSVPETAQQEDYVRDWPGAHAAQAAPAAPAAADPLLQPEVLSAAQVLRSRFHGALLGLATGDAVAAATQYGRPGRFAPVGDLLGGGPFDLPRGGWSDDTAMTLCLAESLLDRDGFEAADQIARYRRWQQDGHLSATGQCLGITAATVRALALSQWRRQPYSGGHDPQAQDPEPLVRVAAVALFDFAQPQAALRDAAEAARTTCQASAVLAACRALAAALHVALAGGQKSAIVAAGRPAGGGPGPETDTASGALAAALDVLGRTGNFRDAVLAAANLGGNSDVVAAVTGALAGAHYGVAAIPGPWRSSLLRRELLEDFADRLLAHALLGLGA